MTDTRLRGEPVGAEPLDTEVQGVDDPVPVRHPVLSSQVSGDTARQPLLTPHFLGNLG
ncbi:hypothetical protein ACWEOA_11800 [Streptomyces sp. NPDC004457]|uniref:hypothetical protein n=1 Tax=Streptomyces spinosus TaxID=2872623 RepID=UPI001CED66DE|nr:hypothetical protein [Streptomyces spinosus]